MGKRKREGVEGFVEDNVQVLCSRFKPSEDSASHLPPSVLRAGLDKVHERLEKEFQRDYGKESREDVVGKVKALQQRDRSKRQHDVSWVDAPLQSRAAALERQLASYPKEWSGARDDSLHAEYKALRAAVQEKLDRHTRQQRRLQRLRDVVGAAEGLDWDNLPTVQGAAHGDLQTLLAQSSKLVKRVGELVAANPALLRKLAQQRDNDDDHAQAPPSQPSLFTPKQ